MPEELLETEAVEVDATLDEAGDRSEAEARPLPVRVVPGALAAWSEEVRTAALAAAGGIVAGAATVAAVRATRGVARRRARGRSLRSRGRPAKIVASRSFLIDVHVLGDR